MNKEMFIKLAEEIKAAIGSNTIIKINDFEDYDNEGGFIILKTNIPFKRFGYNTQKIIVSIQTISFNTIVDVYAPALYTETYSYFYIGNKITEHITHSYPEIDEITDKVKAVITAIIK